MERTNSTSYVRFWRKSNGKCIEAGIIPDVCKEKGKINISQCTMFLSGRDADVVGVRYGKQGERIVPKYIQNILFSILDIGNQYSHSNEKEIEKVKYVLFGLTFQLCEVAKWMKRYIENHPDKEKNKKKWVVIPKKAKSDKVTEANKKPAQEEQQTASKQREPKSKAGTIEPIIGQSDLTFHVGRDFCVSQQLVESQDLSGKQIVVDEWRDTPDEHTRKIFPFMAVKVHVEDGQSDQES